MTIDLGNDAAADVGLSQFGSVGFASDRLPSEYVKPWPPVEENRLDLYLPTVEARYSNDVKKLDATAKLEQRKKHPDGIAQIPKVPSFLQRAGSQALQREAQRRGVPVPRSLPTSPQALKRAGQQAVRQQTRQLRRQAERVVRKEVTRTLKHAATGVGVGQAQKIAQEQLRKMGIPSNIPVQLPKKLTAEGVADAAVATGLTYAENWAQKKTGLPIKLPRKISVKEIERSITGLLPKNAEEAIDLAVNAGIQAASSALAGVIAGAAIGSAVPGLGTVIGIGMGLGYQALKGALKPQPPPGARRCTGRQLPCPQVPALSPIDLIPWAMEQQVVLSRAIAGEQRVRMCGWGPMIECEAAIGTMSMEAFNIVAGSTGRGTQRGYDRSTVKVMGYYSVMRTLQNYERVAPLRITYVDTKKPKVKVRGKSMLQVGQTPGRTGQDIQIITGWLRRRRDALSKLVATANQIERLPARDLASLRFTLITELSNAATQYAFNPSPDNKQWLATLGKYLQRLLAREQQMTRERFERQKQGEKLYAERMKDPAQAAAHQRQILQFQCGEGNQDACRKLKVLPAPRPKVAPARVLPEAQVRGMCDALLNDWLRKNPTKARCVTPAVRKQVIDLCVAAHAKRTIPVPTATARIFAILNRC